MANPHNIEFQRFLCEADVPDPGTTKTIRPTQNGVCRLVSLAAETRTVADPDKVGQELWLNHMTDGGDITLTFATAFTETGQTTYTFSDPGQFLFLKAVRVSSTALAWRKVADYLSGNSGTLITGAGAGITGGAGTIYKNSVGFAGGIFITRILIDLTDLQSSTTDIDIIGQGTSPAYLAQITTAQCGTILTLSMTCLEAPATGVTDIDLYSANEATGKFDDACAGLLTETVLITSGGAWTNGAIKGATTVPPPNDYIYLTCGAGGTVGTYTAGKFLIELLGY